MRLTNEIGKINKAMVFGSAACNRQDGTFYLSEIGEARAERVAELYYSDQFDRRNPNAAILIAGGYGKRFEDAPPHRSQREGRLMEEYLMKRCEIPGSRLVIEDGSTSTIENWQYSMGQYEEFFADVIEGNESLGLVSHPNHLPRAKYIGEQLGCKASMLHTFPTAAQDNAANEAAALTRTKRYFESLVPVAVRRR